MMNIAKSKNTAIDGKICNVLTYKFYSQKNILLLYNYRNYGNAILFHIYAT